MDWVSFPPGVKERYETLSGIDGNLKIACLEQMNTGALAVDPLRDSESYGVFASQFNATMLAAHAFENMFELEGRRWTERGYDDFEITMPEFYFCHPSLDANASKSVAQFPEIRNVVDATKARLHYSKDASFMLGELHKLEFISVFSYLEAYVESLLVEFLGLSKNGAASKVRKESLPKLLKDTLNSIDPAIVHAVELFDAQVFRFLAFCTMLRNLHSHSLGVMTQYRFDEALEEGYIGHDSYAETGKPVTSYARLAFGYTDYVFEVGRRVNLSVIGQPFRLLVREVVTVVEFFLKDLKAAQRDQ